MTTRTSTLAGTAAVWLATWYAPAYAQDPSPLCTALQTAFGVPDAQPDNSPPGEDASRLPKHLCGTIPIPIQSALVLPALIVLPNAPALAREYPNPLEEKRSKHERPVSYGVEIDVSSGHADRGFVISDSPVVKSVTWVSGSAAEFSVWSNLPLADTTEESRPQIVELEVTRAHEWRSFTIAPAVKAYFYRDVLSTDSSRSIEGWLYVSYHAGPFRLFANQSVDLLTYAGGYFGEAGVALDRRLSSRVTVGGSFKTGWASATFNDFWAEIDKSAWNLVGADASLTAYMNRHFYIRPYFEFSSIVDHAVRGGSARPTFFFVGLATGVEF